MSTCSWLRLWGRKPGPGGSSFCTQQLTPGEKWSSTWNLSSLLVSLVGSSYSMITIWGVTWARPHLGHVVELGDEGDVLEGALPLLILALGEEAVSSGPQV